MSARVPRGERRETRGCLRAGRRRNRWRLAPASGGSNGSWPALEEALVDAPADPAAAGTLLTEGPIEEAVLDLLEDNVTRGVSVAVDGAG